MTQTWTVSQADERTLRRIAELIALKVKPGDCLALSGGLGAGKTAFARALVRAATGEPDADVPSPTFSLVQTYEGPRFGIAHLDLYRLNSEAEALDLGVDELLASRVALIEWPERAPAVLGEELLTLKFAETEQDERRTISLEASNSWTGRLERVREMFEFLVACPDWDRAHVAYLQGDASARAYARLTGGKCPALLMDWPQQPDGPPIRNGLPYSRIAHLAEGVAAFSAIDAVLRKHGFEAPHVFAEDLSRGLMLTEDFGDHVFGQRVAAGAPLDDMWLAATEVLADLRALPNPAAERILVSEHITHDVPLYDRGALSIETELLVDWYLPMVTGGAASDQVREDFSRAWPPLFDLVLADPPHLVLRDYHSPNLLWLPERGAAARQKVGLIDFQDAVRGHPAYDLVSLLQDARLDVPADLERRLLDHYCALAAQREAGFDDGRLRQAYAVLGAQRNTKILGIFARLYKRDGKPQYLRHIPRLWQYLERDLSHPVLAGLKTWYDTHLPASLRFVSLAGKS